MRCIYITNSLQPKNQIDQSIHLNIIDEEDPEVTLEGAVFDLFKKNTESKEYEKVKSNLTTNSHGSLEISSLHPGNYLLVETKPPFGYKLDTDKIYLRLGYTSDNQKINHGTIIIRKHKLATTHCPNYCSKSKTNKNQSCKHEHCSCFMLRDYHSHSKLIPNKHYELFCMHQSRCYYKKRKVKNKCTFCKSITCKYSYKYKYDCQHTVSK